MKLAVPKERRPHERRVAASPDTVKKLIQLGFDVVVEKDAGLNSSIPDSAFSAAGATIAADAATTYQDADVIFKVQRPLHGNEGDIDEVSLIKPGAIVAAILSPANDPASVEAYTNGNITAFAMEFMPRITRAQSMDVLSSQSNLAGYRAVIDAAAAYSRAFPMMMTAAGTIAPAKVMVMGAGVAGLQAIATAKRLGAVVSATDVRAVAKEQVESLGGKFVMVESEETGETEGGYAKEMSDDYKAKQAELIATTLAKQDIAITTALIPGRTAPVLITREMVQSMKPGSIIVDLAAEAGGNCELTKAGEVVEENGVKIIGHHNVPSLVSTDASALFAKNLLNFITPLVDAGNKSLNIDWQDEIIVGTLLTKDGAIVHERLKPQNQGGN
ncbi:Re/Si-specific NAD(P)(+) transhydrogenase subunit alpha [Paremcibacter congregatus]|uniref:NAD(P) transhydrogenase subunit alpha part 1 n=1 Tax=Paremcibacter congregatus TaxID=2043170 RepID=A0A2G4YV19_9PROT|nr:Re/Si-specific NAD(P)(+) transhydrogenase subunit alpha [Paremcibacter congregatus]PHZ86179.1 NAD(P)(+) transhydrogenase (Re/Si-specific) subunit alpha [Paremcibacter congregatus]QDE27143.1 Re/Si-specific NAD(P)(+) transhydrogenase subunit alpha [Paremcibacter congregatus]